MSHEDLLELMPVYALDALEGSERLEVRTHLERCGQCREVLAAYQQTSAVLALAAEPVAPPPALRDRLLASAAATPQAPAPIRLASRRSGWQKVAALVAVAALVMAGGLTWSLVHLHSTNSEVARQRALIATISNPAMVSQALVATGGGSAHGRVVDSGPATAVLVADGLANPGSGYYKAWLISDSGSKVTPLGAFRPDASGDAVVQVSAAPASGSEVIAVTLEPHANDPVPQGPKVLQTT